MRRNHLSPSRSLTDNLNEHYAYDVILPTRAWLALQRSYLQQQSISKKLRYREEHSASVVLSWCTCMIFLGRKSNQPLLRN